MNKTVILGREYDDRLRSSLVKLIREIGGRTLSSTWGVGGSQEIETWVVDLHGDQITFEAETYVGLSVSGEHTVIDDLVRKLAEEMK